VRDVGKMRERLTLEVILVAVNSFGMGVAVTLAVVGIRHGNYQDIWCGSALFFIHAAMFLVGLRFPLTRERPDEQ
jgi:hypothetical protein